MERLTERTADGILVKENHGENGLRTFYQCFEEKPNDKYTNCDGGYCAIEKLAAYEDAEEQGQYGKWIPVSERLPEEPEENEIFDNKPLELYLVSIKGDPYPFRVFWNGKFFTNGWQKCEVTAWMPLPKPYRESEE